jgi:hypothetical protein
MNALQARVPITVICLGLFALLASGCVVPGGGYYDAGYYEPYGFNYGGWGMGYDVGPVRAGEFHGRRVFVHGEQRAFRTAGANRAVPSIPSRPRGGGPAHGGRH